MKILNTLVGYLAVTALPFHPFAFASPGPLRLALAATDYDGYVNITTQEHIDDALMKQLLGDILETCQTVTSHYYVNATQNHSDNASLIQRVPGPAIIIPSTLITLAIIAAIGFSIFWIKEDNPKRELFTQNAISKMMSQYPKFNWVVCHSPYQVAFDGVEGTDYGYTHHELKISWGRSIGFDLYWAKSGTFYRYGDGGFINWAYNGNIIGTDNRGATVHFGIIS